MDQAAQIPGYLQHAYRQSQERYQRDCNAIKMQACNITTGGDNHRQYQQEAQHAHVNQRINQAAE